MRTSWLVLTARRLPFGLPSDPHINGCPIDFVTVASDSPPVQVTPVTGYDFSDATLKVSARKNGRPFGASVNIYAVGQSEYVSYGLTSVEFSLMAGAYDIEIVDREVPGKKVIWMRDIRLEAGQVVEKKAEFADALLKVTSVRNNRPVQAEVNIYPSGKEDYITYGVTATEFRLLPGTYNVEFIHKQDSERKSVWMRDIELGAGATRSIKAVFE